MFDTRNSTRAQSKGNAVRHEWKFTKPHTIQKCQNLCNSRSKTCSSKSAPANGGFSFHLRICCSPILARGALCTFLYCIPVTARCMNCFWWTDQSQLLLIGASPKNLFLQKRLNYVRQYWQVYLRLTRQRFRLIVSRYQYMNGILGSLSTDCRSSSPSQATYMMTAPSHEINACIFPMKRNPRCTINRLPIVPCPTLKRNAW